MPSDPSANWLQGKHLLYDGKTQAGKGDIDAMPPDPHQSTLEAAREWLKAYGASRWCEDPECVCCVRDTDSFAALLTRREREAVEEATPGIERAAKAEALEDLRKVIAAGAARSYADATLETLAWVDERIEDAIKAEGGSDAA
jgi:hypothetical protein